MHPSRAALIVTAVFILPSLLLLAPPSAAAQASGPQLTDEEGDARWKGLNEETRKAVTGTCGLTGIAAFIACGHYVSTGGGIGSTPAPPTMDFLSLTFTDRPDALVVDLELAGVERGFESAVPEDGDGAVYFACWTVGERGCSEQIVVYAAREAGALSVHAQFQRYGVWCNVWNWCAWSVPFTLHEGSPGHVRVEVPRHLLPENATAASDPVAGTARVTGTGQDMLAVYSPRAPVWASTNYQASYAVDTAYDGSRHVLQSKPAPAPDGSGVVTHADAEGDVYLTGDTARPDMDVLATEIHETPGTLTLATQVARVDPAPEDHTLYSVVGLPSGDIAIAVVDAVDGEREKHGFLFEGDASGNWSDIPVAVEVRTGAPGWVNVTLARTDLRSPAAGEWTTLGFTTLYWADEQTFGPETLQLLEKYEFKGFDWGTPLPPFRFTTESRALDGGLDGDGPTNVLFVEDGTEDVTLPPLALAGSATRSSEGSEYDITAVSVNPVVPMTSGFYSPPATRITLGVADLTRQVSPPTPYHAVLYAVAVETDAGRFLAGLYKQRGSAEPQFLCAPDNVLLVESADERGDPTDTLWQPITGDMRTAGRAGNGTGSGPSGDTGGTITFQVPHGLCLGRDGAGAITVHQLKAGTYLIQKDSEDGTTISVDELDTLASDVPFLIETKGTGLRSAQTTAWYAAPFGVDNFWDMLGIAAAVVTSTVSVGVVQRQRRVLKRYLHEVDAAASAHQGDVAAQESALLDVRARLKSDFLRGRIRESHYVLVEQRLDEKLTTVRVQSLGDAFGDLPHRLLQRLQQLLADGTLTLEDYNLFCALLDDTGLTEAAKAQVRRKLSRWVAEDASAMSTMRG